MSLTKTGIKGFDPEGTMDWKAFRLLMKSTTPTVTDKPPFGHQPGATGTVPYDGVPLGTRSQGSSENEERHPYSTAAHNFLSKDIKPCVRDESRAASIVGSAAYKTRRGRFSCRGTKHSGGNRQYDTRFVPYAILPSRDPSGLPNMTLGECQYPSHSA